MKRRDVQLELNQAHTTAEVFIKSYNQTIPTGFPVASVAVLKKFQEANPSLFSNKDKWSIEKHRKKLMDWLPSHLNES
ncbi:MAG: hypothetical protein A2931_00970 [Candidatus Niyogibacteria bacterium RIFCSPLOWO2_01_FULL_45_48]|uniref:Uncharacterized protein n=2 Tax=Candidatus Niyogiibacteriota TaxID=1817912 RepID=A0A1G2F082_9BACT|nr:MAG: hypothetical protein A2931_00970 [Candidatus Niyogibacteria bacterium RIFCSPLOWO2_01_FULL_45_48]OGZ30843.1 MAG: hypothetical protein A2835_00985 [Candidatus Niyogibacteria bacterium RIFCSPHIGHO2_01_FULL_45_28]OGZ31459.1 MAG: hypothetical protein A3J00_02455 [Candidatus Niyogibacteria bacterium RIFCSPLOWO2_02_FULL_45_13]